MADRHTGKSDRGFAAMDGDRQREIASRGGQNVPDGKRSFSQDHELAAEAGRKGGQSVSDEKRSFSQDRTLASEAGRKGGQASGGTAEPSARHGKSGPERSAQAGSESGRDTGAEHGSGRGSRGADENDRTSRGDHR